MALKLCLRPGERVAVNGAVIVNGDRRAALIIENRAQIVRERDILQPGSADTPAKRLYLPILMMHLEPSRRADRFAEYERRLTEFAGAVSDREILRLCLKLAAAVANADYYRAMATCRRLIAYEKSRLADVA